MEKDYYVPAPIVQFATLWTNYVDLKPIGRRRVEKIPNDLCHGYHPALDGEGPGTHYLGWRWLPPMVAKEYYPGVSGDVIERVWDDGTIIGYRRHSRSNGKTRPILSDLEEPTF